MKKIRLEIPELKSAHCQQRVKAALEKLDGVQNLTLQTGRAVVDYSSDRVSEATILTVIENAGYPVAQTQEIM